MHFNCTSTGGSSHLALALKPVPIHQLPLPVRPGVGRVAGPVVLGHELPLGDGAHRLRHHRTAAEVPAQRLRDENLEFKGTKTTRLRHPEGPSIKFFPRDLKHFKR